MSIIFVYIYYKKQFKTFLFLESQENKIKINKNGEY